MWTRFFPLFSYIITYIILTTIIVPIFPSFRTVFPIRVARYEYIYIIITIHYLSFPDTFPFVDGTRGAYLHQLQHIGRYNMKYHIVSISETRNYSYNFFPPLHRHRDSWAWRAPDVEASESLREIRSDLERFVHAILLHRTHTVSLPTYLYLYWNRESRRPTFNHQII